MRVFLLSLFISFNAFAGRFLFEEKDGCKVSFEGHLSFFQNHQVVERESVGVSENSLFAIASLTKPMTAYGISLLIKDKKITFETTLGEVFPLIQGAFAQKITIQELLNHRSGLDYYDTKNSRNYNLSNNGFCEYFVENGFPKKTKPRKTKDYRYSNVNYCLLAKVIERVSNQSFASFMKDRVFLEAGMDESFVAEKDLELEGKRRVFSCEENKWFSVYSEGHLMKGAADIISTISDLEKWASFTLHSGYFQESQLSQIKKSLVKKDASVVESSSGDFIYKNGFKYYLYHDELIVGHLGFTYGFRSAFLYYPDSEQSLVYLSNKPPRDNIFSNLQRIRKSVLPKVKFEHGRYMLRSDFEDALQRVEDIYRNYLIPTGVTLKINGHWSSYLRNAKADFFPRINKWRITVHGDYSRSPFITKDVIARVACHELGHFLGGTSFYPESRWSAIEGQADYYATLKCLRFYFEDQDNEAYLKSRDVPKIVRDKCNQVWGRETSDSYICQRSSLAAYDWVSVMTDGKEKVLFSSPSSQVVDEKFLDHPDKQCRLDTMFQGALCNKSHYTPTDGVDTQNYGQGTCTRREGYQIGVRPRCWFKPPRHY